MKKFAFAKNLVIYSSLLLFSSFAQARMVRATVELYKVKAEALSAIVENGLPGAKEYRKQVRDLIREGKSELVTLDTGITESGNIAKIESGSLLRHENEILNNQIIYTETHVGTTLSVSPVVGADGYTFDSVVSYRFNTVVGRVNLGTLNGQLVTKPLFKVFKIEDATIHSWDGLTLLLGQSDAGTSNERAVFIAFIKLCGVGPDGEPIYAEACNQN